MIINRDHKLIRMEIWDATPLGNGLRETKKNYLFMKIFKVLKNFYGFPVGVAEPAEGSRVLPRNVNNGRRSRALWWQHWPLDPGPVPRHATLLHATTPSLLHPLNYRLTWTSWAMRLIIKWTGSRHRANNIGVWQIHNNNKLQRAGSPHSPNIRKLL